LACGRPEKSSSRNADADAGAGAADEEDAGLDEEDGAVAEEEGVDAVPTFRSGGTWMWTLDFFREKMPASAAPSGTRSRLLPRSMWAISANRA
jgi:hypothetical protein